MYIPLFTQQGKLIAHIFYHATVRWKYVAVAGTTPLQNKTAKIQTSSVMPPLYLATRITFKRPLSSLSPGLCNNVKQGGRSLRLYFE